MDERLYMIYYGDQPAYKALGWSHKGYANKQGAGSVMGRIRKYYERFPNRKFDPGQLHVVAFAPVDED